LGDGARIEGSTAPTLPLSSSIALIFLAFFLGLVLAFIIYKIRKSSKTPVVDALSESSHRAEDSQGEKPLNPASLNEQV